MCDDVCGTFCVSLLPLCRGRAWPGGALLQGNGWIRFLAGASIKFTERFSASTIKFQKFTIALGGCCEKRDMLEGRPGVFVLSL